MKKFLIAGNWKMNKNINESEDFIKEIINNFSGEETNVKLLVCPPYTNLSSVNKLIDNKGIYLGAQNCHWEESGAFTGEISLDMLMSVGCRYVIVGHSERRAMFCETDENINKKIHAILRKSLTPVMCIGETLEQRQAGETFDVLTRQLNVGLKDIDAEQIADIVIAYEPVWAIGTGVAASLEQVDEAHNRIRELLVKKFGSAANDTIIQYGGSVNENNSKELFKLKNVNGALIGGASLHPDKFLTIYKNALELV
jgi:triosephosphate isomerase